MHVTLFTPTSSRHSSKMARKCSPSVACSRRRKGADTSNAGWAMKRSIWLSSSGTRRMESDADGAEKFGTSAGSISIIGGVIVSFCLNGKDKPLHNRFPGALGHHMSACRLTHVPELIRRTEQ